MTVNRFFAPLFVAAGLTLAAAPALATDPTPPPPMPIAPMSAAPMVIANDPAKLRVAEGIMTNLRLYEVMVRVGQQTLTDGPLAANYTPNQRAQLAQAFADAMAKRRTTIVQKLAAGCRGDFSMDQLNTLNALSKIKYIQDLIAQGADPGRIADAGSLTVAEQDLIQKVGNEPYVNAFFVQALNFDVIKSDIADAVAEASKR